jgi:hypothetical protein
MDHVIVCKYKALLRDHATVLYHDANALYSGCLLDELRPAFVPIAFRRLPSVLDWIATSNSHLIMLSRTYCTSMVGFCCGNFPTLCLTCSPVLRDYQSKAILV